MRMSSLGVREILCPSLVARSKLLSYFSRFASSFTPSNKRVKQNKFTNHGDSERNSNSRTNESRSSSNSDGSDRRSSEGWKQLPGVRLSTNEESSMSTNKSLSRRNRTKLSDVLSSDPLPFSTSDPSFSTPDPSSSPSSYSSSSPPSSYDSAASVSPVYNIWNEPVIDRRRHKASVSSADSKEMAKRIKTKITQAQTRMLNPASANIPPPSSLRSLLDLPEQQSPPPSAPTLLNPLTSSTSDGSQLDTQPQQHVISQEYGLQEYGSQQHQPSPHTKREQPPHQQPAHASHYHERDNSTTEKLSERIEAEKPLNEIEENQEQETAKKPRRVRPSVKITEEDVSSSDVPRLECLSHTREGSATRKSEWPKISLPQVCFVGKTNSGKSSLLNQFFRGRHLAKSSSRPGVTTSLDFYNIDEKVTFVDTPGYGKNLNRQARNRWEAMVKEYLKYSPHLRLVCLLLDITNLPSEDDLSILRLVQTRCGKQPLKKLSKVPMSDSQADPREHQVSQQIDGALSPLTPDQAHILQIMKGIQARHAVIAEEAKTTNLASIKEETEKDEMAKDHPIPVLLVLTKDDHVTHDQRSNLVHRIKRRLQWSGPFLCYSIKDRRGRGKLLRHIMTTLFQPESSLLLKDMLRPDFVPYGTAAHRGLLKKDHRERHWKIKQREESEARKAGLKTDKRKKEKPDQNGPVQLTEASF